MAPLAGLETGRGEGRGPTKIALLRSYSSPGGGDIFAATVRHKSISPALLGAKSL